MQELYLTDIIQTSDFVLLDTSFFCPDSNLSRDLFDAGKDPDFDQGLCTRLKANNLYWRWLIDEIISQSNVYTHSIAISELTPLKEHLQRVHEYNSTPKRVRKKEWDDLKVKTVKASVRKHNGLLPLLNTYELYLTAVMERLKTYNDKIETTPPQNPVSEVNLKKISPAIDYLFDQPDREVSIFARSEQIERSLLEYVKREVVHPFSGSLTLYHVGEFIDNRFNLKRVINCRFQSPTSSILHLSLPS
ncbi:MAG: hypothetical protein V2A62_04565 [Candidatus Woesearchaeota archaeon]